MTFDRTERVVAIVGPTGSGKSDVAEEVALALDGEIVSADSMQIYTGMDIGTAKVPVDERRVPYHLIDVVEPGREFSAGRYRELAHAAFADIQGRGKVPILVGGTGLYVRAAIDDLEMAPDVDPTIRERWERYLEEQGADALWHELSARDPESAALIHPNNARRVVRALELFEVGIAYAEQASGFSDRDPIVPVALFGIDWDRAELYARIDARVDAMLGSGLLGEVESLYRQGRLIGTAAQAIGYKELVDVIEGRRDVATAVEDIKRSSRRYAKRQLTWFRADPRIRWVEAQGEYPRLSKTIASAIIALLERYES